MPGGVRAALWTGGWTGLLALVIGGIGILTGYPLLFPSLGPILVLQAHTPQHSSAKPWNVIMGHLVGIATAMAVVWLLGAGAAPPVLFSDDLTWLRVAAGALALAVAFAVQAMTRSMHPPAAASVLLVALGGFKVAWEDAAVLIAGVLLVALLGELPRRLGLRQRRA